MSESEFLKVTKEAIARNPELFEALMEFERTKKLPKLYRRKRINLTIDENSLYKFKKYCEEHNINMSRFIEKKMDEATSLQS